MTELSRLPIPAREPEGAFLSESAARQRSRSGPRRRVTPGLLATRVDQVLAAQSEDANAVLAESAWRLGYAAYLDFHSAVSRIEAALAWSAAKAGTTGDHGAGDVIRSGVLDGIDAAREEFRTGRKQPYPWSLW